MSKFFVTGGLGFIGSNLVEHLINSGHQVINIDKVSYSSNIHNVKEVKNHKRYKFFKFDISNSKKIKKLILRHNPKCIFNLAAETHVDRSIDKSDSFIKSNVIGVHSLLEAILKSKKKVKLIHVSTDEVFGSIKKGRANENYPYNPSNPYAATKASSDHLIRSYANTFGINAIITHCCNNYGPRQNPEKFIPKLLANLINRKALQIYGKGKNSREWIYVKDHCEALTHIYKKGKSGESYNIGSSQNYQNNDIAKKLINLSKKMGIYSSKSKILYVKDRPGHDLRYALNNKKIRDKLNWKSKTKLNEGLLKTFKWYFLNKTFFNKLRNKNFNYRLGKIR